MKALFGQHSDRPKLIHTPGSRSLALAAVLAWTGPALAAGISDASFFSGMPHTLITFDVDGAGTPLNIIQGGRLLMPQMEYASQGIQFSPSVYWVNDSGSSFDQAQAIGGSLPIAIPSGLIGDFSITFLVPTHAFGFWVVNNNTAPHLPVFTALDLNGNVIESVTFQAPFIDGTIGVADYGFMGIVSDTQIGSVRITKDAAIFDNLRFSIVPEPGAMALLLVAAALWRQGRGPLPQASTRR